MAEQTPGISELERDKIHMLQEKDGPPKDDNACESEEDDKAKQNETDNDNKKGGEKDVY